MKSINTIFKKGELENLILFSMGELVSLLGSSIYLFAISLYVLRLTGSGLSFSISLVQGVIPIVLIGPFAGVLVDRFSKKRLVVSMDLANAAVFTILFVLCNYYNLTMPIIYITTFLINSLSVIFGISMESAKPSLVTDDNLIKINLISQIINSLSSILGPMIGGIIFVFVDIKYFMLINALSFFFSGISEMLINYDFNNMKRNGHSADVGDFSMKNIFVDMKEGFLYTYKQREIKDIISVLVFLNTAMGLSIMVPLPFAINNVLKLDSSAYGFIQGFFPVGMILGAIAVEKAYRKVPYNRILNISVFIFSVVIIAMGIPLLAFTKFSNELCMVYYGAIMTITGGIISFVDIPIMQKLQTITSEEYRGRVISTSICICKITLPLALILAGILVEIFPILWVFLGIGGLSILYSFYNFRSISASCKEY